MTSVFYLPNKQDILDLKLEKGYEYLWVEDESLIKSFEALGYEVIYQELK